MFERLRSWLLRVLKVSAEPEPPFGDPRSLCVFRASRKLYHLRLIGWSMGQLSALAAIIFWLGVIMVSEREAEKLKAQGRQGNFWANLKPGHNIITTEPLRNVPRVVFQGLWVAKAVGVAVYLAQLFITYAAVRLDYELRWYIVTDRSLRIRSGLWTIQETTMSFANLQQVVVSQGPLQRLFGISDVRVGSAGGGHGPTSEQAPSQSMHAGVFHGVENPTQIRDLILQRLRQFRETGLGDPDEAEGKSHKEAPQAASVRADSSDLLAASHELLEQARKLRSAWASKVS